jgi:hypothetical protein
MGAGAAVRGNWEGEGGKARWGNQEGEEVYQRYPEGNQEVAGVRESILSSCITRRIFRSAFALYDSEKPVKNPWSLVCKLQTASEKTEVSLTITDMVTVITSYGFRLIPVDNHNRGNTTLRCWTPQS